MQSNPSCCSLGKLPWILPLIALALLVALLAKSTGSALAVDPPKTPNRLQAKVKK